MGESDAETGVNCKLHLTKLDGFILWLEKSLYLCSRKTAHICTVCARMSLKIKYMSYNLLKGKRGVIFGALNEMSIAWKVAERAVEEGAVITLSNTPMAVRMGEITALGEKLNAEIIPADATSVEDLEKVFARSMEVLGGKIDFCTALDRHVAQCAEEASLRRLGLRYAFQDPGHLGHFVSQDDSGGQEDGTPSTSMARFWLCRMWLLSARSSAITIWPTPRLCWSR